MKEKLLLALVIAFAVLATSQLALAQSPQWRQYEFRSTCIVVYDFDEDGHLEIIALPGNVIDNYVSIPSPYPPADCGFTVDYDLDGAPELVLVHAGLYAVYRGMTLVAQHALTGRLVLDPNGRAFAVGNTVVFNSTVIEVESATTLHPLTVGSRLYVVYQSGLYAVIDDLSGWRRTVYTGGAEILGVGYSTGRFYILGRARAGGSVLVVYDAHTGNTTVTGFVLEFDRVVLFLPFTGEFLATSGDYLYRVSQTAALLEYTGRTLHSDGLYVYVQRGSALEVYSPALRSAVASIELPAEPAVLGGRYPFIAFSDGSRTYAYVALPPITAAFSAPSRVYVGEVFEYRAYVQNSVDYAVLLNGAPVPPSGRASLNRSGVHVFTVYATNGVVSVTREHRVTAVPRPLTILIFISGVARAYATVNLTVQVYDRVFGGEVRGLECRVNVSGVDYVAESWTPIAVQLLPESLSRAETRVSVRCGDGDYYEETTYETTVPLYPVPPVLLVEYLGEGTLRVIPVSPDGSAPAPGTVEVHVDGRRLGAFAAPATITGIPPGNRTVTVRYYPTVPVFASAFYQLSVFYYEDVTAVPPEVEEVLHVADVVRTVTETVEVTREVPVPVTVAEPVEVPTLSVPAATATGAAGAAAGALAVLLAQRLRRREGAGAPGPEDQRVAVEPG